MFPYWICKNINLAFFTCLLMYRIFYYQMKSQLIFLDFTLMKTHKNCLIQRVKTEKFLIGIRIKTYHFYKMRNKKWFLILGICINVSQYLHAILSFTYYSSSEYLKLTPRTVRAVKGMYILSFAYYSNSKVLHLISRIVGGMYVVVCILLIFQISRTVKGMCILSFAYYSSFKDLHLLSRTVRGMHVIFRISRTVKGMHILSFAYD